MATKFLELNSNNVVVLDYEEYSQLKKQADLNKKEINKLAVEQVNSILEDGKIEVEVHLKINSLEEIITDYPHCTISWEDFCKSDAWCFQSLDGISKAIAHTIRNEVDETFASYKKEVREMAIEIWRNHSKRILRERKWLKGWIITSLIIIAFLTFLVVSN